MYYAKRDMFDVIGKSFSVLDMSEPITTIIDPEWSLNDVIFSFVENSDISGKDEWFGLIKDEKKLYGYIVRDDDILLNSPQDFLETRKVMEFASQINTEITVSADMNVLDMIPLLAIQPYFFVLEKNSINHVVNFYDLDKLPVKICIYSLIIKLEHDLVNILSEKNSIDRYLSYLPKERYIKAKETAAIKYRASYSDISNYQILNSTTFIDKKTMLRKDEELVEKIGMSRERIDSIFKKIENARNCLAHSDSLFSIYKSASEINALINILNELIEKINSIDEKMV